MKKYLYSFLVSILCVSFAPIGQACSLGGPVYSLPLNSEYADVQYDQIGNDLKSYIKNRYGIENWTFVNDEVLKLNVPENTEYIAKVGIELPAQCQSEYHCERVSMFVLSSLPIEKRFLGIRKQPDANSSMTAIINDVEKGYVQGYTHVGDYNLTPAMLEVSNRIRFTERENALYALMTMRNKATGEVKYIINGKRVLTIINTCGARYWSLNEQSAAEFNNHQWQEWNNYFYTNYDDYVDRLGKWMEPYRLKNPKIYVE